MMIQETYVKLEDLHKQGWTIREIATEAGYHPATISKWLREGPPPARRAARDEARVMARRWVERVEALVGAYPRLLGVSVWRCLVAEGFDGCYATVTRELRRIRGPRFSAAERVSVPIHTDPGEEAQFDWVPLTTTPDLPIPDINRSAPHFEQGGLHISSGVALNSQPRAGCGSEVIGRFSEVSLEGCEGVALSVGEVR